MENNEKRKQLIALRNGEMVAENANEYWSDDDNRKSGEMFENGYSKQFCLCVLIRSGSY